MSCVSSTFRIILAAVAVAVLLIGECARAEESFDRGAWVDDFEQMKVAITKSSPNLNWQIAKEFDFKAAEARARSRLAAALNEADARAALQHFVESFDDAHMFLIWPHEPAASSKETAEFTGLSKCADLGYWAGADKGSIAPRLPGYERVTKNDGLVTGGLVKRAGKRVGILRIPLFSPSAHLCAKAIAEIPISPKDPCEEACEDNISRRANALFLHEIEQTIERLAAADAEILLADVAANLGGNDTSIAVARMFAGAQILAPKLSYVRTPARARDLRAGIETLRTGLANATPPERAMLKRLIAELEAARAEAEAPCDLSLIWEGRSVSCSQAVHGPFFAGGLIPNDLPPESVDKFWAETVSATASYKYRRGLWRGPLLVLTDENTASSAELFAAMVQDAGAAVVIGAPTRGAGCGWNMTREDVVLENSGGRLLIPNCARYRKNGDNEIDGIQPDILVGIRRFDTPKRRVERLDLKLNHAVDIVMSRH